MTGPRGLRQCAEGIHAALTALMCVCWQGPPLAPSFLNSC